MNFNWLCYHAINESCYAIGYYNGVIWVVLLYIATGFGIHTGNNIHYNRLLLSLMDKYDRFTDKQTDGQTYQYSSTSLPFEWSE